MQDWLHAVPQAYPVVTHGDDDDSGDLGDDVFLSDAGALSLKIHKTLPLRLVVEERARGGRLELRGWEEGAGGGRLELRGWEEGAGGGRLELRGGCPHRAHMPTI